MKNTLKYFLLIALGFIALYACQQDDFQGHSVHNHENTDRFKRKKVSLEEIENKEVIQQKIETLFSKRSSVNYKTISTINQRNYFLETDEIIYIEDGITHSYTIPMVNLDNPSGLVNLLLSSEDGVEYDIYVVEYNINEEEQLRLMTGEYIDLKNKITFTKADEIGSVIQYRTIGSADDCTTITYVPGVCASGQHQYGDLRCDYLNPPQIDKMAPPFQNIIISYTEDCGGSGAPSPGESETNPNPTNPGSGTGGGSSSIKNPSNTTPLALSNYSKFVFNLNILGRQDIIDYLENEQNEEIEQQIKNYLNTTGFILGGGSAEEQNAEKFEFAEDFLINIIESNLDLDFNNSLKSPMNIDISEIDKDTPEGEKFDCIYNKLMQSPSFKNMFLDTFGGEQDRLNVKFEISNLAPNVAGECHFDPNTMHNTIKINSSMLNGSTAAISITKTIIHESIHAYLNIKKIDCSLGSNIPELNGWDLQELIESFYQGFNCNINVNGVPQSQHVFMFDFLIPTFTNILNEIKDDLISQNHQNMMNEHNDFYNPITNQNESFSFDDFFYYLSLQGLHNSDAFIDIIGGDPVKSAKYTYYKNKTNMLSKNCQ